MTRYRFGSKTNAQNFAHALDAHKVWHAVQSDAFDGDVVVVDEQANWIDDEARQLGGWDVASDRSTSGVEGFLDISSTSIRSNPPDVAREGAITEQDELVIPDQAQAAREPPAGPAQDARSTLMNSVWTGNGRDMLVRLARSPDCPQDA